MYLLSKLAEDKEVTVPRWAPTSGASLQRRSAGVSTHRIRAVQVTLPGLLSLVLLPIAATFPPHCGMCSWTRPTPPVHRRSRERIDGALACR